MIGCVPDPRGTGLMGAPSAFGARSGGGDRRGLVSCWSTRQSRRLRVCDGLVGNLCGPLCLPKRRGDRRAGLARLGAAPTGLQRDWEALLLAEIRRHVDVVLCVSGWAGKEGRRAFVQQRVIGADRKPLGRLLSLVALELCRGRVLKNVRTGDTA